MQTNHPIKVKTIQEVKTIHKPWGWEKWIADGKPEFSYVLKEIYIRTSFKTSLQFHRFKQETTYVQKGRGILYYSEAPIDIYKFNNKGYTDLEIQGLISKVKSQELTPGTVFHVFPGLIHRVEAIEDLFLIESSTVELDDVCRLQDDTNRPDGRIENEYKKLD